MMWKKGIFWFKYFDLNFEIIVTIFLWWNEEYIFKNIILFVTVRSM